MFLKQLHYNNHSVINQTGLQVLTIISVLNFKILIFLIFYMDGFGEYKTNNVLIDFYSVSIQVLRELKINSNL